MSKELEPTEEVLEGVIVGEGMRNGNPQVSGACGDGLHTRCNRYRWDLLSLQDLLCECNCHRPHTVPGFAAGGYIPKPDPRVHLEKLTTAFSWDDFLRGLRSY